jgi:hypothetical protein
MLARRIGAWLLGLALAGPASASCTIEKRADIPVTLMGGQILAAGRVDGKPVTFLIDTGAEKTLLTDTAVQRLGLARDEWVSSHMQGIGGYEHHPNAKLTSLELGGLKLRRRGTEIEGTVSVSPLPFITRTNRAIDGLLGLDYLSSFDVVFDLRRGRMTLYNVDGCAGNFLPWTGPYAAIPAQMPVPGLLLLPAHVNGRPTLAQIDSGSTRSLVSLSTALQAGVTQGVLDRDTQQKVSGLGAAEVTAYEHLFADLRVGDLNLQAKPLLVMRLPPRGSGVVLGMDWLGGQPVWISWATHQVFVSR